MRLIKSSPIKAVLLLTLFFTPAFASETNSLAPAASLSRTNLNAHERFYINYRAQRARLEKGLIDLEKAKADERRLLEMKAAAGAPLTSTGPLGNISLRLAAIDKQLAALELQRAEYEKRNPDAAQYAGIAPRSVPENYALKRVLRNAR